MATPSSTTVTLPGTARPLSAEAERIETFAGQLPRDGSKIKTRISFREGSRPARFVVGSACLSKEKQNSIEIHFEGKRQFRLPSHNVTVDHIAPVLSSTGELIPVPDERADARVPRGCDLFNPSTWRVNTAQDVSYLTLSLHQQLART